MPGSDVPDDLAPGHLPNVHDLLVDLRLRSLVAEDAAEVVHLRGDQAVAFRQEAGGGALKVAFRDGDELRHSLGLLVHDTGNEEGNRNHPSAEPTVFACSPWSA